MWDLDTIIRQNNQAALDWMMRGQKAEAVQSPLPESWALAVLADKLKIGPPLLSELVNSITDFDTIEKFLRLIRTFLPEHEQEILSEVRTRRVYRFSYLFGQKYYPLPVNTDCAVSDLVESMPVELLAMSYSAYHDLDMRPGYLLLLSLVNYPYEGDDRDMEDDAVPFNLRDLSPTKYKPSRSDLAWLRDLVASLAVGGEWIAPMGFTMVKVADNKIELRDADNTPEVKETIRRTLLIAKKTGIKAECTSSGRTSLEKLTGARVPLIDLVQNIVGTDLVNLIPGAGWSPEQLHQMTDKTPYDGVGDFADWVFSQTDCVMLDSSHYDCDYIEGYGEPLFKWTVNNVYLLTEQWPKVQQIRGKIDHRVEWLEANQINNFKELLDFLLKCKPEKAKLKRESFNDPTAHWCELDQQNGEEEDDEEE